jgi:glutamate racemase
MIGVFDSGYGGLSVFRELDRAFPEYDLVYLGDNARAPYGNRSPEVVYEYTKHAIEWLHKKGATFIVLACNTASAEALPRLQKEFLPGHPLEGRVVGVIDPVVAKIKEMNKGGAIGIMATKATIRSRAYYLKLRAALGEKVSIIEEACPLLVPLIEDGRVSDTLANLAVEEYLEPMKKGKVEDLVLGCTHYYFLKSVIESKMPSVTVFDSSSLMPNFVKEYLAAHPAIESSIGRGHERRFYTTDEEKGFYEFVLKTLAIHIKPEKVQV